MLRGKHHIGRAVQCVGTRGVNGQLVPRRSAEVHLGAGGTADPVFLLHLDALRIIHKIQVVDQTLRVVRNLQHPLRFYPAHDLAAAALADTVDDLFVRKHALAGSTPVDGHFLLVREPVLEKLQKDPLRPFVIIRVRRVDLARPVERQTDGLKLLLEARHILLRHDGRVHMVFNRVVFARQAERIPTDRVQHVVTLHPAFARDDVHGRVGTRMPYVEPLPGGVWELDQRVVFRLGGVVGGMKNAGLLPPLLPFLFNRFRIVCRHILFAPILGI